MEFKPDLAEAEERMRAFWARDCIGRCGLQVLAKREDYQPVVEDADLLTRKTDINYILWRSERVFQNHHYLAEAVPTYVPGLVCSDMAAFLSDDITLMEDTVWYRPIIEDWASFSLTFDRNNRWWQLTKHMAEVASKRAAARYLVGIPDFQVAIDIVSLLRSPEKLCLDLIENPDSVRAATAFILNEAYTHCYGEIRSILGRHSAWVGDWMGLFAQGDHDIVQCDFGALISPRHFEEFCLPDIQRQCRMLDASIFHLDGPDAIRHLNALLEIKELDAIQWVPGAGKPPAIGWLPMLRKVQAAGKSLYITSPAADVDGILEELSPRGLMIGVEGVFESGDEGERFVRSVERMCARRCGTAHRRATDEKPFAERHSEFS